MPLAPDQRRFLREKRLERSMTPAQWLAFLRPLASHDRTGDRRRSG